MQGLLFSAISYGSMFTVFISGTLADLYGPRNIILSALLLYMVSTLLSPLLASLGYNFLFVGRTIMGLAEGAMFSSVAALAARWTPPMERSIVSAIYTSGHQIANSLGTIVGSTFCRMGGWTLIFYFSG